MRLGVETKTPTSKANQIQLSFFSNLLTSCQLLKVFLLFQNFAGNQLILLVSSDITKGLSQGVQNVSETEGAH